MSTARNALWAVAQFGGGRFIVFISTVVLARLLDPESFGLLAIALLATNIFDRFKDLGVGPALVQSDRRFADIAPTATVLTFIGSLAMAAICYLSAPFVAHLLSQEEEIPNLLRGLSAYLLISGLSVVPDSALRRRLRFRKRTVPELGGAVVKAVVSILLALQGFEVWSLVYGQVAGSVFTTTAYWLAYRAESGRPGHALGWSETMARQLTTFGLSLSWLSLIGLALDNVDYFCIGRRLGSTELGYYTLAFRLPEMLVTGVVIVIGQVLFSSFSRVQGDPVKLRRAFLSASSAVSCLTVPLGLGLASASSTIVPVVLGQQYLPSVPLLSALGIYATVYALSFHAGEVYKAMGRVRILTWLSVVKIMVLVPAIWIAAGYSTLAVAVTFCCCHVVLTVIRLAVIRRVLALSVAEQLDSMAPALTAGVVMSAMVLLLGYAGKGVLPDAVTLTVQVLVAAVVYVAVLLWCSPNSLAQLLAVLRPEQLPPDIVAGRNAGLTTVVRAVENAGSPTVVVPSLPSRGTVIKAVNVAEAARMLRERQHDPARLGNLFLVIVDSSSPGALGRLVQRFGWTELGRFAVFPHPQAPSHLVRSEVRQAREWFSDGPRPVWGGVTAITSRLGRLPLMGRFTFQGEAVLISRTAGHPWPGSPDGQAPWVIHLGEANSAGRAILTYGDPVQGTPVCHVRIEAARPAPESAVEREKLVLSHLSGSGILGGDAPRLVDTPPCGPVAATGQTHLGGEGLAHRWRANPKLIADDATAVVKQLTELSRIRLTPGELVRLPQQAPVLLHDVPPALRPAVNDGKLLLGGRPILCHGDVWPRNIVWSAGPRLIDWENGHAGTPFTDPVTFAITSLQLGMGGATLSEAARELAWGASSLGCRLREALAEYLGSLGVNPQRAFLPALAYAMCLTSQQLPPGGGVDRSRTLGWTQAAADALATPSQDEICFDAAERGA